MNANKETCFTILIVFCLTVFSAKAQPQDPMAFFPHAVGNIWRTHSYIDNSTRDSQITRDSVSLDGSIHLFYGNSLLPSYKIDTLHHVYQFIHLTDTLGHESLGPVELWYKLEAVDGDTFYTFGNSLKVVVTVSTTSILGQSPIPAKTFTSYLNPGGGWVGSQTIARGFGLVRSIADLGPVDFELTGCIIDGVSYGSLVSVQSASAPTPKTFHLEQNFPNPFNGSTRISFTLARSEYIKLSISDLLGREVFVLREGYISEGTHESVFDSRHFASGLYFCTLQTSSNRQTIKLVLLK